MERLGILVATWFGAGLLKPAPGTWGSLAALPFAWAIAATMDPLALIPAACLLFFIGIWAATLYDQKTGGHDASEIVVDEVVGVWLTLSIIAPSLLGYAIGFALFRVFDILKPWPVTWADKRVEGGMGVMLDDVLAAVYAALCLFVIDLLLLRDLLYDYSRTF